MESELTRSSLVSRARHRDPVAWRELVDLYGPLIAQWCKRCHLDTHATADCVQEVFVAVSRSLDLFLPQRENGSFRSWLWTITSNKLRDAARKGRTTVRGTGGDASIQTMQQVPDDSTVPREEPTEQIHMQALIARGMDQVRADFEPRTWDIFKRAVLDGVANAVVAAEFQTNVAVVRQVRSRVLRRLRQQLGDLDR